MSKHTCEVSIIKSIEDHPNADRMEIAHVAGWDTCVRKGEFKPGDKCIYIPVDSVLNYKTESIIFGPDSKIHLNKHRVRAIRLRGVVSYGLIITLDMAQDIAHAHGHVLGAKVEDVGENLAPYLGITKYEPPERGVGLTRGKRIAKKYRHPLFKKYYDIQHFKKYPNTFENGDWVIISEKIHGTSWRGGWLPYAPRTLWQKIRKLLFLAPKYEWVYGSRNVQLQDGTPPKVWSGPAHNNIYKRAVQKYNLKNKIPKGQVWYGEIFGHGIQKNYSYSKDPGEFGIRFFDIWDAKQNRYFDFYKMVIAVKHVALKIVPFTIVKWRGKKTIERLETWKRPSHIDGKTKPVEGFVIRSVTEQSNHYGRKVLKLLHVEYLLNKTNTDWH